MKDLPGLKELQVKKALTALLKHVAQQQGSTASLLEEDEYILLTVALKKIPEQSRKDKPIRLRIPHPLHQVNGAEVCVFVKDRKGEGHKEAKQRVRQQKIAGISKVIGTSKLRTKYEAPEAKRQLCSSFDLFLADERIIPSLPKLIGKTFFRKKRQPIPVDLQHGNWAAQVKKATEATYMFRPAGNSISIRIARSSFTPEQCTANAVAVLQQAVQHLPGKWKGVRAAFVKTADSVALPIYQRAPEVAKGAAKVVPAAEKVTSEGMQVPGLQAAQSA